MTPASAPITVDCVYPLLDASNPTTVTPTPPDAEAPEPITVFPPKPSAVAPSPITTNPSKEELAVTFAPEPMMVLLYAPFDSRRLLLVCHEHTGLLVSLTEIQSERSCFGVAAPTEALFEHTL